MFGFFKTQKNIDIEIAENLYQKAMTQSRLKTWYLDYGVPDDLDSRIEIVILHLYIWLHHLKDTKTDRQIAKELSSLMIADFDDSYRQDGIGDQGVAKRIAKVVEHFYGLCEKYEQSLRTEDLELLTETIHKNVYGGHDYKNAHPHFWCDYIQSQISHLQQECDDNIILTERNFQVKQG